MENARWRRGGFLFVTTHIVGSFNGTSRFRGRTTADDSAVARRTAAALAWIDSAFAIATADSLLGLVIALHANPRLHRSGEQVYGSLVRRIAEHTATFRGEVLLIHGDTHDHTVDHPLKRVGTDEVLTNFTGLETFGSPDIGWVRVVVDTAAGKFVEFEPRRIR